MKSAIVIIVAAAVGVVAAPAFAAHKADASSVQAKVTYDAKSGKYCVSQVVTGEYLATRDCRTQEEWAKAGLVLSHQPSDQSTAQK